MSTEFPSDPREALEASLTALLLGELPEDQATFVRQAMAQDVELARRYERLKRAIEMVRLAEARPAAMPGEQPPALKLSDQRREALQQKFKTVAPAEFVQPKQRGTNWLVPAGIAALLIAALSIALLPALSRSKSRGMVTARAALDERALREGLQSSKQPASGGMEGDRDLNRKAGSVEQKVQLAEARTKIVLPAEAGAKEAPGPEFARQAFGGGIGGGGGRSSFSGGAAEKPAIATTEPGVGAEAQKRFMQRYGLVDRGFGEGKKAQAEANQQGSDELLAKNLPGQTMSVDPTTGLPVIVVDGTQPHTANSQTPGNWSISASLKGFYADNNSPTTVGELSDSATFGSRTTDAAVIVDPSTGLPVPIAGLTHQPTRPEAPATQPVNAALPESTPSPTTPAFNAMDLNAAILEPAKSSNLASVPAQSTAENEKLRSTVLGDEPIVGKLFQQSGNGTFGRDQTFNFSTSDDKTSTDLNSRAYGATSHGSKTSEEAGQKLAAGKDSEANPSMLLSAETLARVEQLRVEGRSELARLQLEITNLSRAKTEELAQALPKTNLADKLALNSRVDSLKQGLDGLDTEIQKAKAQQSDLPQPKAALPPPIPQPEIQTRNNAFSTFSLNVSDVSFKLAAASLEKGVMPEPAGIRAEEFINAFDYRDPEPVPGAPFGFVWERARYPFAQNRDLLRLSLKTASQGRQAGRPLNLVLLLDNSGSMERADRVRIIHEALRVLAAQLQPQDTISVVTFARTARLWLDGVSGDKAGQIAEEVSGLTPQGGTNLEEAMNRGYQTALRHYRSEGINRVVLLTDGAANLGDVDASRLKEKVETNRKQGVAFDCFGIGWEGYNDDLLETLSRNGDGRYGFLNTPDEASSEFAAQLAGALQVAAADVKVQVEFNPDRVSAYRQIGYAKHQLTKEQFRDNTVDAAELGAAESGNALYVVEVNPAGVGPLATVRVRSKVPGTVDYQEHAWAIPYNGNAAPLDQSSAALRLACTAGAFAEWLSSSPYAAEITPDALLSGLRGIPDIFGADPRPKKIEWMIRQAKSLGGK